MFFESFEVFTSTKLEVIIYFIIYYTNYLFGDIMIVKNNIIQVIGLFFVSFFVLALSGCGTQTINTQNSDGFQELGAEIPPVSIQATVVSATTDTATLYIDSIESEYPLLDCLIEDVLYPAPAVGSELTLPFAYGTGHAIVRTVPLPDTKDSNEVRSVTNHDVEDLSPIGWDSKVQFQEGDYLVTLIESPNVDEVHEEVLPGINEGDQLSFVVYFTCVTDITVREYTVI